MFVLLMFTMHLQTEQLLNGGLVVVVPTDQVRTLVLHRKEILRAYWHVVVVRFRARRPG